VDFEAPAAFPSEWENADALYNAAEKAAAEGAGDLAGRYAAAADALERLARNAVEKYARDKEEEIVSLRQAAIDGGIRMYGGGYLRDADAVTLEAKKEYEAEDYYAAKDKAEEAVTLYKLLKTGVDAYGARLIIVDGGLYGFDPQNADKGDAAGREALNAYGDGDIETAGNKAAEALLRYEAVLAVGMPSLAAAAETERQTAVGLKAPVAVKEEFAKADEVYGRANVSNEAERWGEAAKLYVEAASRFAASGKQAEAKKVQAEKAIEEAERKMLESEETASKAEIILEGGNQ
jgi:hypothetical protein